LAIGKDFPKLDARNERYRIDFGVSPELHLLIRVSMRDNPEILLYSGIIHQPHLVIQQLKSALEFIDGKQRHK
jgi:hypothetical protein